MRKLKNSTVLLLLAVLIGGLNSCTERVDLDLDESYTRLVVEAYISNISENQRVILTTTAPYLSNEPSPKVTGAEVSFSDGDQVWALQEDSAGYYGMNEHFEALEGVGYSLSIVLNEAISDEYEFSASTYLEDLGVLDSIKVVFEEYNGNEFWQVLGWAQNPPGVDFYIFKISVNNECITPLFDDWFIINDEFVSGGYLAGIPTGFFKLEDYPLGMGDTVTLEAVSITEDYDRFLSEVGDESGYTNPMFSGPPANVQGNISGEAWGYFASESSLFSSVIVDSTAYQKSGQ